MKQTEGVLDGRTLGRLDRWRYARALFVRPDGAEAERAVAVAFGRRWSRAQMYGRARRLLIESTPEAFLDQMQDTLGPLANDVRVAPEDPRQTKWDAMSNLAPLSRAKSEVHALWFADLIRAGDFFAKFQPIADLAHGDILGYEGLLRARSNSTSRPSAEMFPAARVFRVERPFETLSWFSVLESAKGLPPGARLFLNVNPQLFADSPEGLDALWRALGEFAFPASRLILDLVEVENVTSLDALVRVVGEARQHGAGVALDDVTSPYRTIQLCEALHPEWVKVDCDITRGVARDARRRPILKVFGRLARQFSFGLIAEGVETSSDLDACRGAGVVAAQGYFIGRPAADPPAAEPAFLDWVARRRTSPPEDEENGENHENPDTEERAS
ncbi:MAG TPA: EAL domain-containing protein [Thermoanaerobaculia bacterium]|nr:EAL domain-containing protein [Thermoanaerobaculia bacterium]